MPDLVFYEGVAQYPIPIRLWLNWLTLVNLASIVFLKRPAARWILAAYVANGVCMITMAELNGFNRLLGINHIVFWTPILVYLYRTRRRTEEPRAYRTWLDLYTISISISLTIDVIDVIRYALGDRG